MSPENLSKKQFQTGKLPLGFGALVAIMSLSLIVNLPGLAVTPMLDTLSKIFPDTTPLEQQMLTTMPNLLIIPFVLMAGKLSQNPHKLAIITLALIIFAGSTVGYMFSNSMLALILFSCSLGIGAGLLIPFSTGLLSDTFGGKPLMKMMGLQSGISNMTLVIATFAVGWLSLGNWHLPFLVYAVCLIPLALSPLLKKIPEAELNPQLADKAHADSGAPAKLDYTCSKDGMNHSRVFGVFLSYFLLTLSTIAISLYTPYLLDSHGMDASVAGTLTSVYFLCVFLPGFFLGPIVGFLKSNTFFICGLAVFAGIAMITFIPNIWVMGAGIIISGLGYGCMQPLIYDKATKTVCRPSLNTKALSIILTANYAAIVIAPFLINALCSLCHKSVESDFPFLVGVFIAAVYFLWIVFGRKRFCFTVDSENMK